MRFKYKVIGTDGEVSCNVDVASDVASRTRYKNLVPTLGTVQGRQKSPSHRLHIGLEGGRGVSKGGRARRGVSLP
jgi:hypothetical protein